MKTETITITIVTLGGVEPCITFPLKLRYNLLVHHKV